MLLPTLLPGDFLLYDVDRAFRPGYLVDWIIRVKTWSSVAHIEVFDSGSSKYNAAFSLASRSTGVKRYPFRRSGLKYVVRPDNWNHEAATIWFERIARGQKYDWLGLFCFTLAVHQGSSNKMFCSEFGRNLARVAGWKCLAEKWPGDKTAPGTFLMVPNSRVVYAPDGDPLYNPDLVPRK